MIKTFTLGLGVVLLGVGVAGVLSGGHAHHLAVFGINASHNAVHILSGIAGIVTALMGLKAAKYFCLIFGAVYGLVTLAGFMNLPQVVSMLNLNTADNWLHLAIAGACLYFGFKTKTTQKSGDRASVS